MRVLVRSRDQRRRHLQRPGGRRPAPTRSPSRSPASRPRSPTCASRRARRPRSSDARSRADLRNGQRAGSSELINTQTATVASTLNADQLNRMPTPTRNALNAVTFLPGVNTRDHQPRIADQRPAGIVRSDHARRRQQQRQLPALVRLVLRLGHAAAGRGRSGHRRDRGRRRDVGGSGAISINFTTRSGTNRFSGTATSTSRHPS